MREARVYVHGVPAGSLQELQQGTKYIFRYDDNYVGPPASLTLPVDRREFLFNDFPPFFEGLLPEGVMLDGLLRQRKIDADDLFSQLVAVGRDTVGAVTVLEEPS